MASRDSMATREEIIAACVSRGIACLAVTDHNHLTVWQEDRVKLIPGEEIFTTGGEVIGLFLREEIPPRLPPAETARLIKAQGGLVYVPHPFDRFRRGSPLRPWALAEIAPYVDIVEGLNARNLRQTDNRRAVEWAEARGLPVGAGSDAHTAQEIGTAYVELDDFASSTEFLANLARGAIGGGISRAWVHLHSMRAKWRNRP
jgi:predicted metal-dependent phosphoesterase TrpH